MAKHGSSREARRQTSAALRQGARVTRRTLTNVRIAKYGVRNFTRNSWLTVAATAVMTITLLIVFATGVIISILNETVKDLRENEISIYAKTGTSDEVLSEMTDKLRSAEDVIEASFVNSQTVCENDIRTTKSDDKEFLSIVQCGGTIEETGQVALTYPAELHIKVVDVSEIDGVKNLVDNDEQFRDNIDPENAPTYISQQKTIATISSWGDIAQRAGIGLAAVFVLISILIVFNTIRMAIFSRREEIEMMKAIGADKKFIRGPFLVEAEMYGLIAAIIATIAGNAIFVGMADWLNGVATTGDVTDFLTQFWWAIGAGMLLLGMAIGYLSARLAVSRYLKD